MPVPALRSMGRRYGVPLARAEGFWRQARKDYGEDYRAVMGTVKKMMANYANRRKGAMKR